MPAKHLYFVAAACALPLSFAACGGSSGNHDDPLPVTPEGSHYGYVVSSVSVPTVAKEKEQFGLDLGGMNSKKLDGIPDNKLGGLLVLLSSSVDIKSAVKKAIDTGTILLLVD